MHAKYEYSEEKDDEGRPLVTYITLSSDEDDDDNSTVPQSQFNYEIDSEDEENEDSLEQVVEEPVKVVQETPQKPELTTPTAPTKKRVYIEEDGTEASTGKKVKVVDLTQDD